MYSKFRGGNSFTSVLEHLNTATIIVSALIKSMLRSWIEFLLKFITFEVVSHSTRPLCSRKKMSYFKMLVKIFSANHYDEKCIAVQIVVRMEWLL